MFVADYYLIIIMLQNVGFLSGMNTFGTDFILMFIGINSEEPLSPELIFTTLERSEVDVTVEVPLRIYKRTLKVTSSSPAFDSLRRDVRMSGTGKSNKGVMVTASAEVALHGINKGLCSTDGFLALPMGMLGNEYYVLSYTPEGSYCELGIVATKDNTAIRLVLPPHGDMRIEYEDKTYVQGGIINVALKKLESFQLITSSDLTGLHVVSNEIIAVYNGHTAMVVGAPGTCQDHSVVQLVPVNRWGKHFAVTSFPDRSNGDIVRLVANVANTTLTVNGNKTLLPYAGWHHDIPLAFDTSVYFTTDKPVLVIQYGQSNADNGSISTAIVPSTEQYQSEYKFTTPDASDDTFVNYAMVMVLETQQGNVYIDSKTVASLGTIWQPIPGSSPAMVATRISVKTGQHHMYMKDMKDEKFGLVLFGRTDKESYSFPGAMGMTMLNSKVRKLSYVVLNISQDASFSRWCNSFFVSQSFTMT